MVSCRKRRHMSEPMNLNARVDSIDEKLDRRFRQVDARFEAVLKLIADEGRDTRRCIEHEGQKTRRHFDVVAEQMKSERNVAIDKTIATDAQLTRLTATNAADHVSFDSRLNELEKRRD